MYKGLFHIYSFCSSITLWGILDYVYNIIDNSSIMNLNTDSNIIRTYGINSLTYDTTSPIVGIAVPTSVEDSSTRTRLIEEMYNQEKRLNELKCENTKLLLELAELKMTKLVFNNLSNTTTHPASHIH